ncbi:hypothetical protein os1_09590 [Comamonadaceae bacterium OS-1]|nr:hypothetical protein os1_09590 [Comamonadaceae bacterium OS-1]
MIAAFLLPYPIRGFRAPYLWIYYKLLSEIQEKMLFLTGNDYKNDAQIWRDDERWEVSNSTLKQLNYEVPTKDLINKHLYEIIPNKIYTDLLKDSADNSIAVFKRILSARIPALEEAISQALSDKKDIEVIITLCNCPSLSAVARSLNIPVAHIELGPLRSPHYLPTAYLDFKGVNGETEAFARYKATNYKFEPSASVQSLRAFFLIDPVDEKNIVTNHHTGVVLQIEDDSNLVAFGEGFTNQDLLVYARLHASNDNLLVRSHPGSLFSPRADHYSIDKSPNSIAFIHRCKKILTINSSVGLEAILMDVPVQILGDCSYRFINEANNSNERVRRLEHYLFAYLVPMHLIFSAEYLRYRLTNPGDAEIIKKHLKFYMLEHVKKIEDLRIELATDKNNISTLNQLIEAKNIEITALNQLLLASKTQFFELNESITKNREEILRLNQENTKIFDENLMFQKNIDLSNARALEYQTINSDLKNQILIRDKKITDLHLICTENEEKFLVANRISATHEATIDILHNSKSWRVTHFLRVAMTALGRTAGITRRAKNALRYIVRGDVSGLRDRVTSIKSEAKALRMAEMPTPTKWGVMTTPHTLFIAHLICSRLKDNGWEVEIITGDPDEFILDMYIVICPQIFKKLPSGEKCIIYQMEQSVSSRWFTEDYIQKLNNCLAVLEYSLVNIEFLSSKSIAYPHVHYLPVGADPSYMADVSSSEKIYDVLFYGDPNSSPRRKKLLKTLSNNFNVQVCSEVFGSDIVRKIKSARVVVNLHYYENALLEMPRIQECLSLGVPVVSESSQDQNDYPEISKAVIFFEEGNEQDMLKVVRQALNTPVDALTVQNAANLGSTRFNFMFDRFLVAMGFINAAKLVISGLPLPRNASRIALSMPETIARRRIYEKSPVDNCHIFDGVRLRPGWVGCGLSYATLAKHALKCDIQRISIFEDDVLISDDFEEKMQIIHDYLDVQNNQWDIFSGVIAVLHDEAKIIKDETYHGIRFLTIDKMTSTVCNIYNQSALKILAKWDSNDRNDQTNTIDKFLERQSNLRVIVALPFLVGHREEVASTLWGFQNTQYRDLIQNSENKLRDKAMLR